MSKKKLIVIVGDNAFIDSFGIETQALDSQGIGTGLPNVKILKNEKADVVAVSGIKELSTVIKNDLQESRDRIIVLGDTSLLPPVEQHRLEEVKKNVSNTIEVAGESPVERTVENIIDKSDGLVDLENEINEEVSLESYLDDRFNSALNSLTDK